MKQRKAKTAKPNQKPPFLPPWMWQLVVAVLARALAGVAFKLLHVLWLWTFWV